jgi:hypothetical protein
MVWPWLVVFYPGFFKPQIDLIRNPSKTGSRFLFFLFCDLMSLDSITLFDGPIKLRQTNKWSERKNGD